MNDDLAPGRAYPDIRFARLCGQRTVARHARGWRPDASAVLPGLVVSEGAGFFRILIALQDEAEIGY